MFARVHIPSFGGATEWLNSEPLGPAELQGRVELECVVHLGMCKVRCMRTNIEIDDEVMREAQRLTGTQTKRETVDLALRELVARHRRLGILDLRGRVHWEGDLEESRRGRA